MRSRHTKYSARAATLRRLLQKPCPREELDNLLGWLNSPEIIRHLRGLSIDIDTTLDDQRRAVYHIPATGRGNAQNYLNAIDTLRVKRKKQ